MPPTSAIPPFQTCYRRASYSLTTSYCYPRTRLMHIPFLDPYLPSPLCVRIICRQVCTILRVGEPPLYLSSSSPFSPTSTSPPLLLTQIETTPFPVPFTTPHRIVPLARLLSLFSFLGFVWVESVSRGHCIVYTYAHLRLARFSRDLFFIHAPPPLFIPPLCILMYPGGTHIRQKTDGMEFWHLDLSKPEWSRLFV